MDKSYKEPVNLTKEDYWYLWKLITEFRASSIVDGHSTTRIRNHDYFDLGNYYTLNETFIDQPNLAALSNNYQLELESKFGIIHHVWNCLHLCVIDISSGASSYRLAIYWNKIDDYFPNKVLEDRRLNCSHEFTTHLYWEEDRCGFNHTMCDHCFAEIKRHKKSDETQKVKSDDGFLMGLLSGVLINYLKKLKLKD
jgi:hypothetical protein